MDQEIDKQDNEPLSPGGLVDILEDLYILLHPHQTARNHFLSISPGNINPESYF